MTGNIASEKPRIAYLTNQYPSVSHTFIRREIRALEALGYRVHRFAIRPGSAVVDPADEEEARQTQYILRGGLKLLLETLPFLFMPASLLALPTLLAMHCRSGCGLVRHVAYWLEAVALYRRLRAAEVRHLHVHFGTNAAAVARLARRMGGPSYSMTIHGPDELDAPVALSLGEKMAEAAFTVPISHYGSAQLRRWVGPSHWERIQVVHCTVDPSWLAEEAPVPDDTRTLVCVGRLSAQKGHLLLIDAFAAVCESHEAARLVLVGDGELRELVEDRIRQHGISNRVEITGWQPESAVRAHLRAARALVLPSFAEGLPVVIMEALAMQRPVLSTYVAGIPELVRPEENGWLVPAGDVEALATAMASVLDAPVARLREMGAAGRARVIARHSAETEARKLDFLFSKVTGP
jgi:glycosyltransferase involved in cell wall biosynthesis